MLEKTTASISLDASMTFGKEVTGLFICRGTKPLTPTHLMYGRWITTLPHPHEEDPEDPDYEISESQVRKRLTNQARLLEHFQARWRQEYLTALQEFHKASKKCSKCEGGWYCFNTWWWTEATKEISYCRQGNDGLVRAVNVHTNNRITSRPISRLYPLEISSPPDSQMYSGHNAAETDKDEEDNLRERPRRAAAKKTRSLLIEWATMLSRPWRETYK